MEVEIFNPNRLPDDQLPRIYGFSNGYDAMNYWAVAIAEDGTRLHGHICSDPKWIPHDLGIIKYVKPQLHENVYQKHYPEGYVMELVRLTQLDNHARFKAAYDIFIHQKSEKKKAQDT